MSATPRFIKIAQEMRSTYRGVKGEAQRAACRLLTLATADC